MDETKSFEQNTITGVSSIFNWKTIVFWGVMGFMLGCFSMGYYLIF